LLPSLHLHPIARAYNFISPLRSSLCHSCQPSVPELAEHRRLPGGRPQRHVHLPAAAWSQQSTSRPSVSFFRFLVI
jgi:hypothetical protein